MGATQSVAMSKYSKLLLEAKEEEEEDELDPPPPPLILLLPPLPLAPPLALWYFC